MKCKGKFINLFAVLIIGLFLIGFTTTGVNDAVDPNKAQFAPDYRALNDGHPLPPSLWANPDNQTLNPMHRIFQIIFILFFISPPLIVILLFMIWSELRKRNEHK